jgi:hypothetical protein
LRRAELIVLILSVFLVLTPAGCKRAKKSAQARSPIVAQTASAVQSASVDAKGSKTQQQPSQAVIAYYFHRTIRCAGCLEIEANAKRVIENSFANQIADKKLIWTPLNFDEPGGEAFAKEFDVSASTLVLSKMKDGNNTQYRKLEKVWGFIHTPKDFDAYVKNEVKQFLNE